MTRRETCVMCSALLPTVLRIEQVNLTRRAADDSSVERHELRVPLWVPDDVSRRELACTVVEVEAFGVKVLLIVREDDEVKASAMAMPIPMQGGTAVAVQLL
jgi:hypothetical protein